MRRVLILLFSLAGLCCAQGGYSGPGRYVIVNVKSGKALDLNRSGVIQNNPDGSRTQQWNVRNAGPGLVNIINEAGGCALTPGGTANSTPLSCNPFRNGPYQVWSLQAGKDGNPLIVSQMGKVVDVPNGTSNPGTPLQTYDRNGDSNQRFVFQRPAIRPR
jgi:Ricin-type beta-trefoil lectin domain-like